MASWQLPSAAATAAADFALRPIPGGDIPDSDADIRHRAPWPLPPSCGDGRIALRRSPAPGHRCSSVPSTNYCDMASVLPFRVTLLTGLLKDGIFSIDDPMTGSGTARLTRCSSSAAAAF
jgi:hypothetical protein